MLQNNLQETGSLIFEELNILKTSNSYNSEDQFIQLIAERVLELLQQDVDLLFSYLYRLDIDERKINHVLNEQMKIPPHRGLAELIFTRQMQRLESKKKYKQESIEGWDEW